MRSCSLSPAPTAAFATPAAQPISVMAAPWKAPWACNLLSPTCCAPSSSDTILTGGPYACFPLDRQLLRRQRQDQLQGRRRVDVPRSWQRQFAGNHAESHDAGTLFLARRREEEGQRGRHRKED